MSIETKVCRVCGETKPVEEFRMTSATGGKYPRRHSYCDPCRRAYTNDYRARRGLKRTSAQNKAADLRKYGLTVEQAQGRLAAQDGLCPLCLRSLTLGSVASDDENVEMDRLPGHIDHDHKTGEVRGVLCSDCNRGLGCFRDSTFALEMAAEYLRESRA